MKSIFITIAFFTIAEFATGQIIFQKTIGGTSDDLGSSIQQTSDGGYIISGETRSYGAGSRDVYLVKLDSLGDTDWSKTYGGNAEDYSLALDKTSDGGYIIGAHTGSFGQGSHDYYLIRTDSNGDTLFTKLYGGTAPDGIYSLHQVLGNGYIIGGHTSSFGAGVHDFYLIKTNTIGDIEWTKTYGGSNADNFRSVAFIELADNPYYALVGETSGFGVEGIDILAIRTDGFTGDTIWAKTIGGSNNDYAYGVYTTLDSGLIIVGHTNSFGAGGMDVYVIKTDFSGNIQWSKTYGGAGNEFGYAIQQTSDNGYVIVGSTTSFGAGQKDIYVIKTDVNGDTVWTKTFGGSMDEVGYSIQQTSDGGYIITGNTTSFGAGQKDIYVIKIDANGNSGCNESPTNTVVNNVTAMETVPSLIVNSGTITSNSTTITSNTTALNLSTCNILGINSSNISENKIKVFPNPFSESVTIQFNYMSGNYTFSLYSTIGQLVRKIENINSNEIHIERNNLKTGLYFFQIQNNFKVIGTGKLIIK